MIHLHVHSCYSMRQGPARVEQLAAQAAELGYPALALTDTGGLYGLVEFYRACQDSGVRPILGVELLLPAGRLVLLARHLEGYRALCRLTTSFHENQEFITPERLAEESGGLFILATTTEALNWLAPLQGLHHESLPVLWALVERFDNPAARRRERALLEAASGLNIPLVAGGDVYFLKPSGWHVHRVLRAIDTGTTLETLPDEETAPKEAYLRSPEEMQRLYRDLPEAIANTQRIAEACSAELSLGSVEFPAFPVPEEESAFSHLWRICFEGARRRYRPVTPKVIKRLSYELGIIEEMNLAAYFLIVHDIVEFCAREGIPCVGRGSAADSLVSYVLRITHGCPIEHDLYFERFLNRERKGAPDIDLDLCWRRRDKVLEYVYQRYGTARVAMICTFQHFCARGAFREVAKVFGLPAGEIQRMSRGLPGYGSLHSALQDGSRPEASTLPRDENLYERILTAAKAIDGLPRHLATHPCGIVVGAHPLTERTALETAPKGLRVTQYDMHGVEDVGLLKIDLLGQRSLSVVADVVHTGGGELNLNGLPPLDPGTYRMINDGRTVGCFQLESPGMRQLLRKLKVDCMETLIASISVIRPGPNDAGMMRHYVDRHNGREKATYLDPRLEPVLRATYGILLYQEDVLKVANVIAGMTLGEADVFRRAMTKLRTPEKMGSNHRRFMEGAIAGGTSFEVAAELWRQVSGFAGYAFCKAHSVSYGILAYQSAYLKAHYPARFMTAVINNGGGFYSTAVYVEEARRLGLCILPPDVNLSEADFTAGDCWLRAGLRWIRSLSRETRNRLLQERKKRAFASAEDLFFRVRPLRQEMESLIRCGALDGFGDPRRALLWRLDLMLEERPRPEPEDGLFNEASLSWQSLQPAVRAMPRFHDLSPAERLRWDQETLGFAVSEHPMALLRREGTLRGCIPASQLPRHVGKRVTVAGMIRTAKGTMTKRSERMKFVTIEDETGLLDIVLFPKAYRRWGTVLPGRRALRVTGLVQEDGGGLTLTAEKVEGIDSLPGPAVLTTAEEPEEME